MEKKVLTHNVVVGNLSIRDIRALWSERWRGKEETPEAQEEFRRGKWAIFAVYEETRDALCACAPEPLEAYLHHLGVFWEILEHGSYTVRFSPASAGGNMEALQRFLVQLKQNWVGIVEVSFPETFSEPPQVSFAIPTHN